MAVTGVLKFFNTQIIFRVTVTKIIAVNPDKIVGLKTQKMNGINNNKRITSETLNHFSDSIIPFQLIMAYHKNAAPNHR